MDKDDQRRQFIDELWRRYEEVQQWAIENWPDRERPLSASDFVAARKEILALGTAGSGARQRTPEPAEGGPQYVDVTPAPWP